MLSSSMLILHVIHIDNELLIGSLNITHLYHIIKMSCSIHVLDYSYGNMSRTQGMPTF